MLNNWKMAMGVSIAMAIGATQACNTTTTTDTTPAPDAGLNCGPGSQACGASCTVVASDPGNCGACGTKCAASEVCSNGKCAGTCASNLMQCGQSCFDAKNDPANCGMCAKACAMGETCANGACSASGTCSQGLTSCSSTAMSPDDGGAPFDGGPGTAICVDLQNNDRHCGACGNFCYGNTKCSSGKCEACTLCGGKCVDLRNNDLSCGTCGNACAADGGTTSCKNNHCCQQKIGTVYLQDDFRDTSKNWALDTDWQIGPAIESSSCNSTPGQDPKNDHTGAGDNGLAGVVIGGCTGTSLHSFYYMTSASFDTSAATKAVFGFWRHLHSDYIPYMHDSVEVWDGNAWQSLFANDNSGINDGDWTYFSYDVTQYKNAQMKVRFGFDVGSDGAYDSASWSIDDVLVADDDCTP